MTRPILTLALSVLAASSSIAAAQELKPTDAFGLHVDLPEDWATTEYHTGSLPGFGVYFARGEDGGYFWMQVAEISEDTPVSDNAPDAESLTDGATLGPFPFASSVAGYRDGYAVWKDGLANFAFVAVHEGRSYRFRLGHEFAVADTDEFALGSADILRRKVLGSISFLE